MRLSRWDPNRLSRALRAREPVTLATADIGDWLPAEIVPLCHAVERPEWQAWLAPPARPNPRPEARVTVVIPAWRAAPLALRALRAQDEPVDIRVAWNGQLQAPEMPEATVQNVAWLGHGRTRQAALAGITTPYVLFLVDDATPLGAGFVRTMVEHLEQGYDAVWARQIAWPDATRRARNRLRDWCPAEGPVPETRLDHVCALHRISLLRVDPLDDVPIAEDWAWGRRHRCGLVAGAPVLHSHRPSFRGSFRRTRAIHGVLRAAGEPATVGGVGDLLRALPGCALDRDALGELLGQVGIATRGAPRPGWVPRAGAKR